MWSVTLTSFYVGFMGAFVRNQENGAMLREIQMYVEVNILNSKVNNLHQCIELNTQDIFIKVLNSRHVCQGIELKACVSRY